MSARQEYLVLINPISGRGLGRRMAGPLADAFSRLGIKAEVIVLPGPGAALGLIQSRIERSTAVIAVGGDGTVNEAAAAIYQSGLRRPIGLVPLGLSNCLARHFHLPLDLEAAVRIIARGRRQTLDLIEFGGRVAVSFLGFGFDAAVVEKVAGRRRGAIRNLAYVSAAWSSLFQPVWPELEVEVDGRRIPGRYYQVLLSQTVNYARFFRLPPRPGFQACLFRGSGPIGLIRSLVRLGWQRDLERACDSAWPVKQSLRVVSNRGPGFFQYDGEAGGVLPFHGEVRPEALEVIV
ncbi:MAG: diacylglycerol kinase family protein [Thermodesulfobacteriota bacterium]